MVKLAPPLDRRTAEDIVQQVKQLLSIYLPDQFAADRPLGSNNEALVRIFAHYGELMIQRLNQTPEKNFLAFLNLLGASQLPPQPARVPLTFYLSTGNEADAVVPIGTQVAALPEKGKSDPTIFETERELIVTATQLKSLWSHDPAQDRYTDHRQLLQPRATSAESVFQGKNLLEHTLYLGHSQILGHEHLQTLDIIWKLERSSEDERSLQWQIWNGADWEVITPSVDETNGLRQSGKLSFSNLKTVPVVAVHSQQNHWIRGRLTTPIVNSNEPRPDSVRVSQLPVIAEVSLRTDLSQSNLKPEAAFTNTFPLDFSKPFFPLGEKPAFGDTFYLACRPAFGQIDARIKLKVSLMDRSIKPSANLKLVWEYSQGQQWVVLGSSTTAKDTSPTDDLFKFKDGTFALTKTGEVEFTIPAEQKSAIATLNGVENIWLRVRIEEGNYGLESQIRPNLSDSGKLQDPPILFDPATFAPPCIREIAISYQLEQTAMQTTAEAIALVIENNFQFTTAQVPFAPFQPSPDENPALYLGFQPPVNQRFPNRVLSLYVAALVSEYRPDVQHDHSSSARLIWEYWDGLTWQTLTVEDSTRALTHSGLVEFLVPESFRPSLQFGIEQYWLRLRWEQGSYGIAPQLRQVLLNTTMASQTVTVQNEILGSSDGSENQMLRTVRSPILVGQVLEVQEPESWVRWEEVPDFHGSSPSDRQYVIHRLKGEVLFGNGVNGRIPPIGSGNIRMTRYQSGGGSLGNRASGTIAELKTTLPYIDRVANPQAAAGGAEAETLAALKERAPRMIRHGGRAVTLEDYEDLAMLASPGVARAKCIPLKPLSTNSQNTQNTPGAVSVIVVPESLDMKPVPSLELLDRVQDYLSARALPTANLAVVGPLYVKVELDVEACLSSLDDAEAVKKAICEALQQFLHPLTGGFEGRGWPFGREPHKSDFYALLEAIPGVDHVRSLKIREAVDRRIDQTVDDTEDLAQTKKTGRFLVYSGMHRIQLTLDR
jgi:predicted phage baseplate assembly protein